MNIRKATIADMEDLVSLFDQYRIFYQQQGDKPKATAFLRERMEKEESVILVATVNGQLTGFTQLYPIFSSVSMQRTWLLNDLFVTPSFRGKGVATALLGAAKELGTHSVSKWLLLQTGKDNRAAQQLYEKLGWKKEPDLFYRLDL